MEYRGLGISYHRLVDSDDLPFEERSFSTLSEAFHHYADFHANVSKKIVDMTIRNKILLIDCHSFSAHPNLLNPTSPDIDICLGYNDDETRPCKKVIENIVRFFESFGYKVGINEPFSNSKTFPVPVEYHSVMIEINKRLYMNEETLEKKEHFYGLHQILQELYGILLRMA